METERRLVHTSLLPIRWGDMDAFGHVNNTVYFRYMEQARVEFFESLGYVLLVNASLVIVNAGCTFMIPFTYPGTVELKLYSGKPGRSSIPTTYEFRRQGDERLFATGDAKIVWIEQSTGKSVPIPDKLRLVLDGA